MPVRFAILGLDPIQQHWLAAAGALVAAGEIAVTGVGHRTLSAAKEIAAGLKLPSSLPPVAAFDDLRTMMKEAAPEVIVLDRPSNVGLDFLLGCAREGVAIFSLGPPVQTLAEALALAAVLPAKTHLLHIWPRFADSPAARQCAAADDFVRPIRFATATWMGVNHAAAKAALAGAAAPDFPVRSLSVLAWDALATLIRLMETPTSIYAAIRGTVASGSAFADLSGAAALTLRFPNDAVASVTLCDRLPASTDPPLPNAQAPDSHPGLPLAAPRRANPWTQRTLLLWGNGTLNLDGDTYAFRDSDGRLIDAGPSGEVGPSGEPLAPFVSTTDRALAALREFLRHYALPPSPHRGWEHRLAETAATMEALVVSHRTGQPESPDKFRHLRR